MNISALQLFTIGIGPSSSHTVGPMRAALQFLQQIESSGNAQRIERVQCDFYGSLAATGKGHGTDHAIMLGWMGETPEHVNVDAIAEKLSSLRSSKSLTLPWG